MVNAPGWYCFPLVYGNAVKNGEANTSAYISPLTGRYFLTNFINHLGNDITDPYINNNADCTVSQAELCGRMPRTWSVTSPTKAAGRRHT